MLKKMYKNERGIKQVFIQERVFTSSTGRCRKNKGGDMNALGVTTRSAWMLRLNGRIEPRVSEAQLIEAVLNKYGITDIWGDS
jgi:hypothetical protein